MKRLQDFEIAGIDGGENPIPGLDGQVTLLVNVASQCGLTPQYAGLQKLYSELIEFTYEMAAQDGTVLPELKREAA